MHEQTGVKINCWVDKGIRPLVDAFNRISCVETVASCQGDNDNPAYVYFRTRESTEDTLQLSKKIAAKLNTHPLRGAVRLRVEWVGADEPMAQIELPHSEIQNCADFLIENVV